MLPSHGTFEGCPEDQDGMCDYGTVLEGLRKRLESIDYAAICLE